MGNRQNEDKPTGASAAGIMARLSKPAIELYFVECVGVTNSTNTLAKRLAAQGCAAGHVIIAEGQTEGRGRLGRAFFSPRGSGLYMSVVLRPKGELASPELITTAAAVAVCRAIEEVAAANPEIKWVNDVLVGGRKVCGILTEGAASPSGGIEYAVLGIGINLAAPAGGFPPEIADVAGALFEYEPPSDIFERAAAAVLENFAKLYLLPGASRDEIVRSYKLYCSTPGKHVEVIRGNERRPALALALDDSLRLIVRYDEGGETEALSFGEISVKPSRRT